MIRKNCELAYTFQFGRPFLNTADYSQQLLVIDWIVTLSRRVLLRKEGDGS